MLAAAAAVTILRIVVRGSTRHRLDALCFQLLLKSRDDHLPLSNVVAHRNAAQVFTVHTAFD